MTIWVWGIHLAGVRWAGSPPRFLALEASPRSAARRDGGRPRRQASKWRLAPNPHPTGAFYFGPSPPQRTAGEMAWQSCRPWSARGVRRPGARWRVRGWTPWRRRHRGAPARSPGPGGELVIAVGGPPALQVATSGFARGHDSRSAERLFARATRRGYGRTYRSFGRHQIATDVPDQRTGPPGRPCGRLPGRCQDRPRRACRWQSPIQSLSGVARHRLAGPEPALLGAIPGHCSATGRASPRLRSGLAECPSGPDPLGSQGGVRARPFAEEGRPSPAPGSRPMRKMWVWQSDLPPRRRSRCASPRGPTTACG